jgi:hypothetical protein
MNLSARRIAKIAALPALLAAFMPGEALAHASERGHVLLLPTGYYSIGGALAVAASFLVLALVPPRLLTGIWSKELVLFPLRAEAKTVTSLLSFLFFAILVAAGFWGSRDPLSNPLPLTIWTLLWVAMALVQGLLGDAWAWLNPWYGPCRLVARFRRNDAPLALPQRLGMWPAVVLLLAFAWFELVYPAPDDPERLARAAGLYWLATFIAMLIFGHEQWSRRGEFLSVFFRVLSHFALLGRDEQGRLTLRWPGARLLETGPLPKSGVAFVLLALSSVSFDGLTHTFFWMGILGVNPLDFPGRTAVMAPNTIGLLASFAVLGAVFMLAVRLGDALAGQTGRDDSAGLLVWSIVPIALAYHLAHYLAALMVDSQYALVALSDPFALDWNLFGTAHLHVEAAITSGAGAAWVLWNIQAGAIVAGHVLAVLVAHALACRLYGDARRATFSQLPLTLLMIGYTVFGLWLLATPSAG